MSVRSRTALARVVGAAVALLSGACAAPIPDRGAEAVAWLGDDTLTVASLADVLVLAQPLPLTRASALTLARHWLGAAALVRISPDSLRSNAWTRVARWPDYRSAVIDARLDRLVPRDEMPSADEVEAAYAGPRYRLPARILRRTSAEAHPEERQRQRDAAFAIHRQLLDGLSWSDAVVGSDDEETRDRGGLLGLVTRSDLEAGLERTVFTLPPGAISPVIETPQGYQIVYRPRLDEIRLLFRDYLAEAKVSGGRRVWGDSVIAARGVDFVVGADSLLIDVFSNPDRARGRTLAHWDGGRLDDTIALRYLDTLDPEGRARLATAGEVAAANLLPEVARQEVIWQALGMPRAGHDADSVGPAAWTTIRTGWNAQVATYETVLRENSADGIPTPTRYLESVVARRTPPLAVPPAIVARVTRRVPSGVRDAGVDAAIARARRLLEGAAEGGA